MHQLDAKQIKQVTSRFSQLEGLHDGIIHRIETIAKNMSIYCAYHLREWCNAGVAGVTHYRNMANLHTDVQMIVSEDKRQRIYNALVSDNCRQALAFHGHNWDIRSPIFKEEELQGEGPALAVFRCKIARRSSSWKALVGEAVSRMASPLSNKLGTPALSLDAVRILGDIIINTMVIRTVVDPTDNMSIELAKLETPTDLQSD